jgi:hypothetical protein
MLEFHLNEVMKDLPIIRIIARVDPYHSRLNVPRNPVCFLDVLGKDLSSPISTSHPPSSDIYIPNFLNHMSYHLLSEPPLPQS